MSAALVRKSLEIVDEDRVPKTKKQKKEMKAKHIFGGGKLKNMEGSKKLTISELRKTMKPKEEIYKKNLEKLKLIKSLTTIKLNEDTLNKIIERGVTKKPVCGKPKTKKNKKDKETVFTEEDFRKFEEEYVGE